MKDELQSQVLLYQASDGATRLEVRMEDETVCQSQSQMVELFQTTKQNISLHIQNLFAEGELEKALATKTQRHEAAPRQ